jgi:hypothetical protein
VASGALDAAAPSPARPHRSVTPFLEYDFAGLGSTGSIGRIIEIATLDALGLENSIARCRVLIAAATAASRLLEVGELEARLAVLLVGSRAKTAGRSSRPSGKLRRLGPSVVDSMRCPDTMAA